MIDIITYAMQTDAGYKTLAMLYAPQQVVPL
jgi:hypothetical protein